VALAFAPEMGMEEKQVARLASAFGGGLGRMRYVCGAVSGMAMVLGMLRGYHSPTDTAGKADLYKLIQERAGVFQAEHGSVICKEILGNPPSDAAPTPRTPEFYALRPCARMVYTAAELTEQALAN